MPIKHPALYAAVYARSIQALNELETWKPKGSRRVFRSGNTADAGRAGADKYRTIYQSSTNDDYRWTGPRPPGAAPSHKPAAGGLYTSLDMNDALLGEFAQYAFRTTIDEDVRRQLNGHMPRLTASTFQPALGAKRIFEYEFPSGIAIADVALNSNAGRQFLAALGADDSVNSSLAAAHYDSVPTAYVASDDHSLPRAIAQAIRDGAPGYRGLRVTSARSEAGTSFGEETGNNIVFFGADGLLILDLRPVREISFKPGSNGRMRDEISPL